MACFSFTMLSTLLLLSAPEVHIGDSFSLLVTGSSEASNQHVDLVAARGEAESVWLRVRNGDAERRLESCSVVWAGDAGITTTVYTMAAPPDGVDTPRTLRPFTPKMLAPGETTEILLRLKVPRGADSGPRKAEVVLEFAEGEPLEPSLTLEVFDFTLPATSSFPVLFGLDHAGIKTACGRTPALEAWKDIYDLLAGLRVGFQVWPERTPWTGVFYDYGDIDLIKAHLEYAADLDGPAALAFGGAAGELLERWPAPVLDSPQDPLQYLLFSIMGTLEGAGWQRPAVLAPVATPATRDDWPDVRKASARVARADGRVQRLIAAPLHPFFERYTDIWALPASTPDYALALLREGRSLIRYAPLEGATFAGSRGGPGAMGAYVTTPGDAFDGSEVSVWRARSGGAGDAPWLEATLNSPAMVESLAVVWAGPDPGDLPEVETAYHVDAHRRATVRWERNNARTEGGQAISYGEFRYPRECRAIRLGFPARDVAVAEILINQNGETTVDRSHDPVRPWLDLRTRPDAGLNARGTLAARTLPWLCWQRGFEGIFGPSLNAEEHALLSCGPGGVEPALALLHFSDGLEDFEYLVRYWDEVRRGSIEPPDRVNPGAIPGGADGATPAETAEILREQRFWMGRMLSGQSVVTRNFGPRGRR